MNDRTNLKKSLLYFLSIALIVLIAHSCGGDDDGPNPGPDPVNKETVTKTYKVGRSDHFGKGWKNGNIDVSANSNNTNKEIKFSKTITVSKSSNDKSKSTNYVLDSVTIEWMDQVVYREKNPSLSSTTSNTADVSNSLDLYSHVITIPSIDVYGTTWYAIQNKDTLRVVEADTGDPSRAIIDFTNNESTTIVDLVGTYDRGVIEIPNVEVKDEYTYDKDVAFLDENKYYTGDVAINALLNGQLTPNVDIKLINTVVQDSVYYGRTNDLGQAIFRGLFIDNSNPANPNAAYYALLTTEEGTFLPTEAIVGILPDEEGEVNGAKNVDLNALPNDQDIYSIIYDSNTLNPLTNMTVDLIDTNTQQIIDTQVTDGNGEVRFADVAEGTNVQLRNRGSNYYTKTNGIYELPDDIVHVSQMSTGKNMAAVKKVNMRDGTPVTADMINTYLTQTFDISLVTVGKPIYLPPAERIDDYKQHFLEVEKLLGLPEGTIYFVNNKGPQTYDESNYQNPYPNGLNGTGNSRILTPMISNVESYSGTNTSKVRANLFNGNEIITNVKNWKLGGIGDWGRTDHEIVNGVSNMPAHSKYPTSRATTGAISIQDSKHDSAIMPIIFRGAVLHYNKTDNNLELIEYTLPTKYE